MDCSARFKLPFWLVVKKNSLNIYSKLLYKNNFITPITTTSYYNFLIPLLNMSHFTLENDNKYIQIITLGCQFNSPEERYRVGAQIVCDRCQSTPIRQGYGLGNQDLCLPCVDKVRATCNMPRLDDPLTPTLMCQRQFRPPSGKLTFMLQDQFTDTRGGNAGEFSITNMRQRQYNVRERTEVREDEDDYIGEGWGLFDDPIPARAQHIDPQTTPDWRAGTGMGRGNGNRDQLAQRFEESIATSQNTKPPNQESGWLTKMISEQYMEDCLTGRGRGRNNGDEISRRLEEMRRLREQPIPAASNMDDLPGFSISGGQSLDAQFGSLLSAPNQSGTRPQPETTKQQVSSYPRTSSGMFRTRMAMGMFK
jgi:hypothetical protein